MIRWKFALIFDLGTPETVYPCGHSRDDMWHDLAEKIIEVEKKAGKNVYDVRFLADCSEVDDDA